MGFDTSEIKAGEKTLVHLPAGLMNKAWDIKGELFWADPCLGCCDVPPWDGKILSIGHSGIDTEKVRFILLPSDLELKLEFSPPEGKAGIIYTSQYKEQAEKIKEKVDGIFGRPGGVYTHFPGQITGCDITSAKNIEDKVDYFIFVGEGKFHTYRFAQLSKPVYSLKGEILPGGKKNLSLLVLKKEKFGILVSRKPGQFFMEKAKKVKESLEKMGKKAIIIVGDTFCYSHLSNFMADCFVTCACPRICDDDIEGKPVLLPEDVFGAEKIWKK